MNKAPSVAILPALSSALFYVFPIGSVFDRRATPRDVEYTAPFFSISPFSNPNLKTNDPHRQTRHGMSTPIYKSIAKKFPAVGICKTCHAAHAKTGGVFGRNQRLLERPEQHGKLARIKQVTSCKIAPDEEYLVACGSSCGLRAGCIIPSQSITCCVHAAIGASMFMLETHRTTAPDRMRDFASSLPPCSKATTCICAEKRNAAQPQSRHYFRCHAASRTPAHGHASALATGCLKRGSTRII